MRLFIPSLPSPYLTTASESVTALLNFFMMTDGSSRMETEAFGFGSDLDIFCVGF